MLSNRSLLSLITVLSLFYTSCNNAATTDEEASTAVETPVEVSKVSHAPMSEYIELNATATFLLKNIIKANANGYLIAVPITLGQPVSIGQLLFRLKTKEAVSLGNSLSNLDSNFRFSGINNIHASENGFISQLDHQQGDYVQDGEPLATISDNNSFVFVMSMPYELKQFVTNNKDVSLTLPDGTALQGVIKAAMPTVDSFSQAQNIVIKITGKNIAIPENLVAKVRIIKQSKATTISVPKAAVLTDETQSNFWVMKMSGDHIALKIPVKKGIETQESIEIIDPTFSDSDRIIVSGNYGLEDSAKVIVTKTFE